MNTITETTPSLTEAQISHVRAIASEGRDATIKAIREALKRRSGAMWSIKGGTGTAWGWIKITAPPARRTWGTRLKPGCIAHEPDNYEEYDTGEPDRNMSPSDRMDLGGMMGLGRDAWRDGESVPASTAHARVALCRALHGHAGPFTAEQYWD